MTSEKMSDLFTKQNGSELIDELTKNKQLNSVTLEQGPLNKNTYTRELETVVRAFLKNKAGKSEDAVTFSVEDGTLFATLKDEKYNINEAIKNANMSHFNSSDPENASFVQEDMDNYISFYSGPECQYEPRLGGVDGIPSDQDYKNQERNTKYPDALKNLSLAEKSAINIYTGAFYKQCNPLLRLEQKALNNLEDNPELAGEILATVAFACSGLNCIDEIPWCDLELFSSDSVLQKNKLHLEIQNGAIQYHTLDPAGNKVTGVITQDQLPDCILTKQTIIDNLWQFLPDILKITGEREHTPRTSIPINTFRMEQNENAALNQKRIDAIEKGEIIQESSIYSTAAGVSNDISDIEENKMGLDMGALSGVVFSDLRGKYTAGIARKPNEAEYTIPPTQMQFVSYHKNEAGGYIFYAKPVQTLTGLSDEQKYGKMIKNNSDASSELSSKFKDMKENYTNILKNTEDNVDEHNQTMTPK